MAIDGFHQRQAEAFQGYSYEAAGRACALVDRLGQRLHVEVEGLERVPEGRALLVANHGFGFDVAFAAAALYRATGRPVWCLGEHAWWKFPYLRKLAVAVGVVDGTPENVDRLLGRDQLVLVLPGGLREAMKPAELRYRLLWGHRYGFVRAAIRNQAPLVPLAAIGADDIFALAGNAFERGDKWLRSFFPLPRFVSMPHRERLRYVFGAPITPPAPPADERDPELLRRLRHEVEGALQELIDIELARRAGFPLGPMDPPERAADEGR